jgi:hypothetical protein
LKHWASSDASAKGDISHERMNWRLNSGPNKRKSRSDREAELKKWNGWMEPGALFA